MSRFSGRFLPASWGDHSGSPRTQAKRLKRAEAEERNAATPKARRRATRERAAGRKLVDGQWTS